MNLIIWFVVIWCYIWLVVIFTLYMTGRYINVITYMLQSDVALSYDKSRLTLTLTDKIWYD